jgi:hypothetical protein
MEFLEVLMGVTFGTMLPAFPFLIILRFLDNSLSVQWYFAIGELSAH